MTHFDFKEILSLHNEYFFGYDHFVLINSKYLPFVKGSLGFNFREYERQDFKVEKEDASNTTPGAYILLEIMEGKMYVGSSGAVGNRISQHKSDIRNKRHRNSNLRKLTQNKSIENFDLFVFFTKDREEAFDVEQYLLDFFKSSDLLLNTAIDARKGLKGLKLSPKHLEALIKANTGRIITEEQREFRSKRIREVFEEHPEYRLKISHARKTSQKCIEQFDQLHKAKQQSISVFGIEYESLTKASLNSGYTNNELRKFLKNEHPEVFWTSGVVSPTKGRLQSDEQRKKLSDRRKSDPALLEQFRKAQEKQRKPIIFNGIHYPSVFHAWKATGISESTIHKQLVKTNGKNTDGPYVLNYIKDQPRKVLIDGTIYDSVREAARITGIERTTIKGRLKTGKYSYA